MPVPISSFLIPGSSGVPFVLEDIYFRGGFRAVATLAARDAIVTQARKAGMQVYVQADRKTYRFIDDAWTEIPDIRYHQGGDQDTANAALIKGSFGVGAPIELNTSASLNSLVNVSCDYVGEDLANSPFPGLVFVTVKVFGDHVVQTAVNGVSGESMSRAFSGGEFSEWSGSGHGVAEDIDQLYDVLIAGFNAMSSAVETQNGSQP